MQWRCIAVQLYVIGDSVLHVRRHGDKVPTLQAAVRGCPDTSHLSTASPLVVQHNMEERLQVPLAQLAILFTNRPCLL